MKKLVYHKKKGGPIQEAIRRYRGTRTAHRLAKLNKEIQGNHQFQKELRQLRQGYPYPDECLKQPTPGNIAKLNNYTKAWDSFGKKWNIDSGWLRMFNKVVVKRPFEISLQPVLQPITKDQFQKEKLNFDKILPVLIKTGYVSKDMFFTKKSLRLDNKFKRHFPRYTESQFRKIEDILKRSCKSTPSIEAIGPHTEQEFRDMEPLYTLHSYNIWGNPPVRSGRKNDLNRNRAIREEYKRRRKKRESARDLLIELSKRHGLSTERINYIVQSKKFDR